MACSTPACARNAKLMEIPNNKWGEDPGPAEQNINQDRGWLQRQECDSLQSLWSRSDWSCFIKVVGRWFEIFFCMIVRFWWCHQIPAHYLTSLALGYNKRTTFQPSNLPTQKIIFIYNPGAWTIIWAAMFWSEQLSMVVESVSWPRSHPVIIVSNYWLLTQVITTHGHLLVNINIFRTLLSWHLVNNNRSLLCSALLVKFDRFSVAPAKYWYNTVLFVLQQEQVRWYPGILTRVTISQTLKK